MTAIVETDRSRLSVLQAMLHGSVPLESMEALSEHIGCDARRSSRSSSARRSPWTTQQSSRSGRGCTSPTSASSCSARPSTPTPCRRRCAAACARSWSPATSRASPRPSAVRGRSPSAIAQTMEDETQAAAQRGPVRGAGARRRQPASRRRDAHGQDHHGLLHQGRRGQEPDGHQRRGVAGRPGQLGLHRRPRRQQRRHRDHAPAHADADAQRPGRLPRRHRRRRHRDARDPVVQDPGRGRRAGAPRRSGPGHDRGRRQAARHPGACLRLRRGRHLRASSTTSR